MYDELRNFFKDYLVNNVTPDFSVSLTKEDILAEQEATAENQFSPTYLETLALLRKLAEILPLESADMCYILPFPSSSVKEEGINIDETYLSLFSSENTQKWNC